MPRDDRRSNPKGPRQNRRLKRAIKHADPIALVDGALTLLPHIDQRRKTAKRAKQIATSILKDLGFKDAKDMPSWRRQLIARAAGAAVECESMEARKQNGEHVDNYAYAAMSRLYQHTLERLGIDTRIRPRDYDDSHPDDAHEPQFIRRVIVNPTEPVSRT